MVYIFKLAITHEVQEQFVRALIIQYIEANQDRAGVVPVIHETVEW
jgi:hypothetical protein